MKVDRTAPPASIGPYEIVASLGSGGGGQVFRAWDPRLEREVALKILHDRSGADPERLRRFVSEARAASALNHPNILTVFDAAIDGDTPFIVSEVIDGGTLREELRKGPVPMKRLLDLVTQIADGLTAAHEAGIVHRDLKPENIMVTRSGRVKILDFGLAGSGQLRPGSAASPANETETVTEDGLLAGTIPYMSPEQARGAASDVRSDQFSFGLIVYEMTAGRHPFRRSTPAETLHAIINEELPPPSGADARAPLMLRWITERCLSKAPEDRYGATADLYRDLRTLRDRLGEALAREGTTAPPPSSAWRRVATAGAIVTALVAGAILGWLSLAREPGDGAGLSYSPLTTAPAYEGFPAWSPRGDSVAYVAEVNGVLQIWQRDPQSPSSASQVTDSAYDCKYPFWSPDGKRIYYVSRAQEREAIWSVLVGGGKPQVVVLNAVRGAISPDGRTLAFFRDESQANVVSSLALYLATPPGAAPWSRDAVEAAATRHAPFAERRFVEGALAFSPDGRTLGVSAIGEWNNPERWWQFWIVPLPGGTPTRRLQWLNLDVAPRVSSFTWMSDSRHVVLGLISISSSRSHLWMADLKSDRAWVVTSTPVGEEYPSTSRTGEDIVYTKDDSDYDVVEIPLGGGPVRPILESSRNETDPVWSQDGGLLAHVTNRSGQDEIWVRDREGRLDDRPIVTQRNFDDDDLTVMLGTPSFSPDGQRIAFLRTGKNPIWPLRVWYSAVAGGKASPLLPITHVAYQGAPSWSPDSQWIAVAEWTGDKWRLVKVRVGSDERQELRTDGVPNATPKWSPAGDWITWETAQGFMLVSADGTRERVLSNDQWHAHTWSRDGSEILGIRETDDYRLSVEAIEARPKGRTRVLAELGAAPPANNPVKGLSLSADGRTLVTSLLRLRGDLWIVRGVHPRHRPWWVPGWFRPSP